MKIPKAPSYRTVFLFGAAWNGIIERSTWATLACLGVALIITGVSWIESRLAGIGRSW